jgi:hypothetical protein
MTARLANQLPGNEVGMYFDGMSWEWLVSTTADGESTTLSLGPDREGRPLDADGHGEGWPRLLAALDDAASREPGEPSGFGRSDATRAANPPGSTVELPAVTGGAKRGVGDATSSVPDAPPLPHNDELNPSTRF